MTQLSSDTPIKTATGRCGVVSTATGSDLLPNHCLILFPSGDRQWILAEILERVAS